MMKINGWKYYNHAAIPSTAPHESVNMEPLIDGDIWKVGGYPLLARWHTDWDCGYKTNWWFCIRDGEFSLEKLGSTQRKHIRQSLKHNTIVKTMVEDSIIDELYRIYTEAVSHYSLADNIQCKDSFVKGLMARKSKIVLFLAYDENHELLAYMTVRPEKDYVEIETAKFGNKAMKLQSSNALYYTILDYYLNVEKKKYISSGSRSINHETGTQDYKERMFGYRKAYCHLHIKYRPSILWLVTILYPFRKLLKRFDNNVKIHQMNSVLLMEELSRNRIDEK